MWCGDEEDRAVARHLPRTAGMDFTEEGIDQEGHGPQEGVVLPVAHGIELLDHLRRLCALRTSGGIFALDEGSGLVAAILVVMGLWRTAIRLLLWFGHVCGENASIVFGEMKPGEQSAQQSIPISGLLPSGTASGAKEEMAFGPSQFVMGVETTWESRDAMFVRVDGSSRGSYREERASGCCSSSC